MIGFIRRLFARKSGPLHLFINVNCRGVIYAGVVPAANAAQAVAQRIMYQLVLSTGTMHVCDYWTRAESHLTKAERVMIEAAQQTNAAVLPNAKENT